MLFNAFTNQLEYVVHVALSASLQVVDEYADTLHRKAIVRQRTIAPISDRTILHPPPSYTDILQAAQGVMANAAVATSRLLL